MTNKRKRRPRSQADSKTKLFSGFWYVAVLLYLEICLSISCFQSLNSFFCILFSSISIGLMIYAVTNLGKQKRKTQYIISLVVTFILTFLYVSQVVYYKIFGTFYTLSSLTMAGDAAQYSEILFKVLFSNIGAVLIMFIPFVASIFFKKYLTRNFVPIARICLGFIGLIIYVVMHLLLSTSFLSSSGTTSVYNSSYMPSLSFQTYGAAVSLHSDITQLLGFRSSSTLDSLNATYDSDTDTNALVMDSDGTLTDSEDAATTEEENTTIVYEEQVLDIDFSALIESETDDTLLSLHTYFSNADTQMQNEYTGMFEGQNLILITAESFSSYCIDEELTPTLYKLYSEGFQFTNFYTPGWSVSTTDGEYVALTGLIPKSGVRSFTVSADNYLPFTMGMQTTSYGYSPIVAYHNHTYDYYSRDLSHPNMGYDYKALGLGLEVTATWPESDLEMMELSVADYIDSDEPFHAYYMTVSGHQLYTFTGNYIAYQNKSYTDDLDYSEAVRAYLSANIELDLALEYLLEELEAAGKLENTVIAISADHYPYGLTLDELAEMNGDTVDDNFGKYENAFILWSGSMEEPIVVDKLAQSLDIIPTLSNLMGFDYDSRLLMGNDILGDDYDPLIIFSNRSFITEEGFYNSTTKEFTENEGIEEVSSEYIQEKLNIIDLKFELSELILDTDYYGEILLD